MYASREDEDYVPREAKEFYKIYVKAGALSPEIVKNREIQEEDSESPIFTERTSKHVVVNDVYVAVGKDDTDVLKWTLENAASSGSTRVFLVHVFPPVTHVPTPGNTSSPVKVFLVHVCPCSLLYLWDSDQTLHAFIKYLFSGSYM